MRPIQEVPIKIKVSGSMDIDADDSSDEEGSGNPLSTAKDYKELTKASNKNEDILSNEMDPQGYSFKVFNLAVEHLYSPQVNSIYYQKKKALPESKVTFDPKKLEDFLTSLLFDTLQKCFNVPNQERFGDQLFQKFWEKNKLLIIETINTIWIANNLRTFLLQTREPYLPLSPAIEKCLSPIKLLAMQFINGLKEIQPDPPPFFNYASHFHDHLTTILIDFYNGVGYAKNWVYLNKSERKPLEPQNPLNNILVAHANQFNGNSRVKSNVQLFAEFICLEARKVNSIIEIVRDNNNVLYFRFKLGITAEMISKSDIAFLFPESSQHFLTYIPVTLNDLQVKFVQKIQSTTYENGLSALFRNSLIVRADELKANLTLTRGVLAQQFTLGAHNISEHLANIRLVMRVQRRRIRQFREDYSSVFQGEKFQLAWQFYLNTDLVLETQEITKKFGRNDLVENLSTYKNIYGTMKKFIDRITEALAKKNGTSVSDYEMAFWIRDILLYGKPVIQFTNVNNNANLKFEDIPNSDQKIFLKFLINFAYLLFGCEIQRNPACLIIHQMALDLIIARKMTWENAIADPQYENHCGGGALPMTMGSYKKEKLPSSTEKKVPKESSLPVATARMMHQRYNLFSVKKWTYEGNSSSTSPSKHGHIKEFIKREHGIVRDWILFKSEQKKHMNKDFNLEKEIGDSLQKEWYPSKK
jgi:hypothetical protein